MSEKIPHIFLDTEVFERHHFDFASPSFMRLSRLASEGELRLISTDVTVAEVKSHIEKSTTSATKQFADARKLNRLTQSILTAEQVEELGALSDTELAEQLRKEFDKFLEDTKTHIVSVDCVPPSIIFNKYFQTQPPFNSTNKKAEFPDAFAGAAIESWCATSSDTPIRVVSGDGDWKRMCQESKHLTHVKQLGELLELFADAVVASDLKAAMMERSDELEAYLIKQVEDGQIYFYVDDSVIDGEIVDVEEPSVEVSDVYVVEVKEDAATLVVLYNVNISLGVSADDPDSTYRDPDDHELRSVWTESGYVEREIEIEATVEVTFPSEGPKNITIESISVAEQGIEITIEDGELSRDDDYEDWEHDSYSPDESENPDEFEELPEEPE